VRQGLLQLADARVGNQFMLFRLKALSIIKPKAEANQSIFHNKKGFNPFDQMLAFKDERQQGCLHFVIYSYQALQGDIVTKCQISSELLQRAIHNTEMIAEQESATTGYQNGLVDSS
jgi:hypothetical protein